MPDFDPTLPALPHGAGLILVEAPRGEARRRWLAERLGPRRDDGVARHLLACDFDFAGPWAGLKELLEELVPDLRRRAPELLRRHAAELSLILPRLRPELQVANLTLTDLASPEEKTRNYPMDRAFRILDGVVDLLAAWHRIAGLEGWILACDDLDRAGALVRRFFRTLLRRRGADLGLTLVACGEPGRLGAGDFDGSVPAAHLRPPLSAGPEEATDPAEMGRRARELAARIDQDTVELQEGLPQVVYYWRHSDTPEHAAPLQALAFGEYNHFGFYEDALRYGEAIVGHLDRISGPGRPFTRWNLVGALANCYLALGRPDDALAIVHAEGLPHLDDPADVARAHYVLALVYSRFLAPPDLARGEELIASGLEALARARLADHERHFLHVFLLNGLAFIRHRQKRPEEALTLCQEGFELLRETLQASAHRLHRSVLLFNIAQVYASLGAPDRAIEHLSAAIEFDPHYSEYFNDRGNAFLALGRLAEAEADYRRAIELSAPYPEVWTNLGQALKLAGRHGEAVEAYARSLDFDPGPALPWLGRAQSWEALGRPESALADYDAALAREPDQPLALANRAGLRFEAGDVAGALADLDRAVALAPQEAGLRYNRAFALEGAGRGREAAEELRAYLALDPAAADRDEVEARLAGIGAAA